MPVHGEINPLDPAQRWDDDLGAFVSAGGAPPDISDEQFDEIRIFFEAAIVAGNAYPLSLLLEPANRQIDRYIQAAAFHRKSRLIMVANSIKMLMRNHRRDEGESSPYTPDVVKEFSFKTFIEEADIIRRNIERAARLASASPRAAPAPRPANVDAVTLGEMRDSDSPFMCCIGILRMKRNGRIWWDDFHKDIFTDWNGSEDDRVLPMVSLSEETLLNIKAWLIPHEKVLAKLGTLTLQEVVSHVATKDKRNELTSWLNSLQWDGIERLEDMATTVWQVSTNDADRLEYAKKVAANILVSAVARAYEPGVQMKSMAILNGSQDLAKSKAIRVLAGDKFYRVVSSKAGDKDFVIAMQGAWIMEIAELRSLARYGTDDPHVKDVLSTTHDWIRMPYGKRNQLFPRSNIFIGSSNETDWHTDPTGGTRFWPLMVGGVDLDYLEANRDQLWAEAVRKYRAGFEYWTVPGAAHAEALADVAQSHPLMDRVRDRLLLGTLSGSLYTGLAGSPEAILPAEDPGGSGDELGGSAYEEAQCGNLVTTLRVGVFWMGIPLREIDRAERQIGRLLRGLGWEKRRAMIGGAQRRLWVPGPEALATIEAAESPTTGVGYRRAHNPDEDIPF